MLSKNNRSALSLARSILGCGARKLSRTVSRTTEEGLGVDDADTSLQCLSGSLVTSALAEQETEHPNLSTSFFAGVSPSVAQGQFD